MNSSAQQTNSIVVDLHDSDWNDWAERLADFQVHAEYGHYRQHVGFSTALAIESQPRFVISLLPSGEIAASSLVRKILTNNYGLTRLSIDRGPCLLGAEFLGPHLTALKMHLKPSAHWLRVNPYFCGDGAVAADVILRQAGFLPTRGTTGEYDGTISINLSLSESDIWQQFRSSVRRQIRRAERLGIEISCDENGDSAEEFFSYCQDAAQSRHFGLPGGAGALKFFLAASKTRPKPIVFLSRLEHRCIAGIGLIPAGNRLIYEWGFSGTQPDDRRLPLSHRLHWEAICWARKQGYSYYDLGGFWMNNGAHDSINRFKMGLSSNIQSVLAEYYLPLSPTLGRVVEVAIALRRRFKLRDDRG